MSFFIPEAAAQTAGAAPQGSSPIATLVMFGGLFVFMWFFIIRPQRKQQKEHKSLMDSLAKGQEVVMTSGIVGKVVSVDGDYIALKCSDTVELRFQKAAVHAVLPKGTVKSIG